VVSQRAGIDQPKARVFISYSRSDMAFADRIEAGLKERGFSPLIDRSDIYAFEAWWERIKSLIGQADTIIFVLSPDAVKSDVALKEVAYAASLNKRFAPIVCRRVEDAAMPEALRQLNFIFFDDPHGFDASADKLAEALQTDIGWIRRHTEFGDTAHRWVDAGQPGGMLLRPPVLDQAEAWMTFRPGNAPAPAAETEAFIAASRKAEVAARRRSRILNIALYTMLVGIILGLVGWIEQSFIQNEWLWWTSQRWFVAANIQPFALKPQAEQALKPGDSFRECPTRQPNADYCPDMVVVPAGTFAMGSPPTDTNASSDEFPQHQVTIAKPFAMSKFETTFAEWEACVAGGGCNGYRPSDAGFGREEHPVIYMSWDDAEQYVAWLAKTTGKAYRLLTEAEYEYAMRTGTSMEYPWGNDIKLNGEAMANCNGCGSQWDGKQTAPVGTFIGGRFVGSFPANAFGLYDMMGNVWEWVEDCYHSSYLGAPADGSAWISDDCSLRVLRGASWDYGVWNIRSGARGRGTPSGRNGKFGFRVGRTLTP
jgi:formylglycine-generating enzyme required for sulfatase activity